MNIRQLHPDYLRRLQKADKGRECAHKENKRVNEKEVEYFVLVGNCSGRIGRSNSRRLSSSKKVLCVGIDVDMEAQRLGRHGDELKRP